MLPSFTHPLLEYLQRQGARCLSRPIFCIHKEGEQPHPALNPEWSEVWVGLEKRRVGLLG